MAENVVEDFSRARILVVGDLMLDRFVSGRVDRISPEAPVPVFRWESEREMLGGAGNVIANLHALGAHTALVCRVGDDAEALRAGELLRAAGAELVAVRSAAVPTIRKTLRRQRPPCSAHGPREGRSVGGGGGGGVARGNRAYRVGL